MKIKSVFLGAVLSIALIITNYSNAGIVFLTTHSRANCVGFNETISWHLNHNYMLNTTSRHTNPEYRYSCNIITGWQDTWRSAAYHYAEGYGGWHVDGAHYIAYSGVVQILAYTEADGCNIYDGWWEH